MFSLILEEILNESVVSIDDINDAIDNHKRVILNYKTKGEDKALGPRIAEIYAYGLTKAGNPVIRAFEPYGDTTTRVPQWKFFRLDRIIGWKETKQRFTRPANEYYKGLGEFNPNGDESMSIVYKVAKFGNEKVDNIDYDVAQPKKKDDVYRTDSEKEITKRYEKLKQQLDNPITLSDLKTSDSFNSLKKDTSLSSNEPKTKQDNRPSEPSYKDEVTKSLEPLRNKIANARKIDISKVPGYNKKYGNKNNEIERMRQKIGNTEQPIPFGELNKKLSQNDTPIQSSEPSYKDEVTKSLEPLRNKIANARKIDLNKIPKR